MAVATSWQGASEGCCIECRPTWARVISRRQWKSRGDYSVWWRERRWTEIRRAGQIADRLAAILLASLAGPRR